MNHVVKHEPIDVDDLYKDVEVVSVRQTPSTSTRQKRKRVPPGSSQKPIIIDSDDESINGLDRGLKRTHLDASDGAFVQTPPVAGPSRSGCSSAARTAVPTPICNTRFHGLAAPAVTPSPKNSAPNSTYVIRGSPRQNRLNADSPRRHEGIAVKMAADKDPPIKHEELYFSSSDEPWEVEDSASDEDEDEDEEAATYNEAHSNRLMRLSPTRPRNPIQTKVLQKAETSEPAVASSDQLKVRASNCLKNPMRIWHPGMYQMGYGLTRPAPLAVDYRQVRSSPGGRLGLGMRRETIKSNTFNCWLNMPSLRLSSVFRKTSGSANKVAQSHEFIAVASPTSGGGPDPDMSSSTPEVDPYNKEGNLVVWKGQKNIVLDGHSRSWPARDEELLRRCTKYYTVFDVAFDPLRPNRLVSSGTDCTVRIVDLETCGDTFSPRSIETITYRHVTYDIAFKPNTSMFAVGCFDGAVHVHHDNERFAFSVSYDGEGRQREAGVCRPGTFIWGASSENPALSNTLFVSSESEQENVCRHIAFDLQSRSAEFELDINDSGDAMALDPEGKTLALITKTGDTHALSLFDVARRSGKRYFGTSLYSLERDARASRNRDGIYGNRTYGNETLEVTRAAFSPDGVFLALARTDNETHIYDVRYLRSGDASAEKPWAKLKHAWVRRPREVNEEFGVTGLMWVEGAARGGLGLVTGGADGCVRLWDISRCSRETDESMVLATVEHDVACFSVGDMSKNERRLVVGDCAGEVYIFD